MIFSLYLMGLSYLFWSRFHYGWPMSSLALASIFLVVFGLVLMIRKHPKKAITIALAILALILSLFILDILFYGLKKLLHFYQAPAIFESTLVSAELLRWTKHLNWASPWLPALGIMLVLTLFFIFTQNKKRTYPLYVLPFIIFVVMWFLYVEIPASVYSFYLVGWISYSIFLNHGLWEKENSQYTETHRYKWSLTLATFLLSIAVLIISNLMIFMFPVEAMNAAVSTRLPVLISHRTEYDAPTIGLFSLSETAFQQGSRLGGSVEFAKEERLLFTVSLHEPFHENLYLKSRVRDAYTGKSWESTDPSFRKGFEHYLSPIENQNLLDHKARHLSGEITMKALESLSILAPMGFYASDINPEHLYVSRNNEAFYRRRYVIQPIRQYTFSATKRDFFLESEEQFLQLPEGIDPEVYALADHFYQSYARPTERLEAMVQYFQSHYDYSLEVADHGDSDFVSFFIMEMESAYCTYFASAFTVLARMQGLPARYVEGFILTKDHMRDHGSTKDIPVTEMMAHAWSEVYLEGMGWMIFEATPAFIDETFFERQEWVEAAEIENRSFERTTESHTRAEIDRDNPPLDEDFYELFYENFQTEGGVSPQLDSVEEPQVEEETRKSILRYILPLIITGLLLLWNQKRTLSFQGQMKAVQREIRAFYRRHQLLNESHLPPTDLWESFGIQPETINLWLKIIYDHPRNIQEADLIQSRMSIEKEKKRLRVHWIEKRGFFLYTKMIIFDLLKIGRS